jgi:LEA14-like dessication related protein
MLSLTGNEIAKMFNFQMDRVEPRLNIALPLENSSIDFTIYLKVENTTGNPLTAMTFSGALELEQGGTSHYLGGISINNTISLPAKGTAFFPITLSLGYNAVRSAWGPLTSATTSNKASVWRLSGSMGIRINKVTVSVPVNLSKATGR